MFWRMTLDGEEFVHETEYNEKKERKWEFGPYIAIEDWDSPKGF